MFALHFKGISPTKDYFNVHKGKNLFLCCRLLIELLLKSCKHNLIKISGNLPKKIVKMINKN